MAKLYFEDFSVGTVAEYGDMLVTAQDIKEFAAEFDPQPMHLDEEAAKHTMVGGLCASGWQTCSMLMRMTADGYLANTSCLGSPGVEEVRWMKPVRPGDRLRARATVLDTRDSKSRPDMGLVKAKLEVLTAEDVCVMHSTWTIMFARRIPRTQPAASQEAS